MIRLLPLLAAIIILLMAPPTALAQSTVTDRFQIQADCSTLQASAGAAHALLWANTSPLPNNSHALECSSSFPIASSRALRGTLVSERGDRGDYRWEGFWFGAGAMGLMIGMLVHDACSDSTANRPCFMRTVGGVLMGGSMGGVLGGLIGRTIPKEKRVR